MSNNTIAEVQVQTPSGKEEANFLSPDVTMILLTWITFLSLLAILYKFAWKPILAGLDAREELIRRAVENAEKTNRELAQIHQERDKVIAQAQQEAKEVVEQSRKAAIEAAKVIQQKTREEAQIILENAQREIQSQQEKVQAELKELSAQIAVQLASKLIEENLDEKKNKKLVDDFIRNI